LCGIHNILMGTNRVSTSQPPIYATRPNETLFGTLGDARETLEEWQEDYNWRRPHSALGNLTPMEFLQRKDMDKMAA
jgi:transposase InsO family protein